EILAGVDFPYPVIPLVRAHHEKWDGTGYPDGLKEEEIPIGARILGVADAFISMTSERPHRPAMPVAKALSELAAQAGTKYDPRVISVLKRRHRELLDSAQSG